MIVSLSGGIGNQLFQYAFGRSVSVARGEPLFFDKSSFEKDSLRHYQLGSYDLEILLPNLIEHCAPVYQEKNLLFHQEVYEQWPGTHYQGYWQNEKYLNAEIIRKELGQPNGTPNQGCIYMANRIKSSPDSCFVGVRRSDYLWPERINYHGVMSSDYYALANLELPVNLNREYFVFTDDIPWAKENLPEFFTIVDVNGPEEKHWDIWMMSLCKHAIIANSSFHWWGAWLGPDKNAGTVVAPKQWFCNNLPNDIVPDRWIKI